MKIMEIVNSPSNTLYDLSINARVDPDKDRITKFNDGSKHRKPMISLKHINRLKKIVAARDNEFKARQELMSLMYGIPDDPESSEF